VQINEHASLNVVAITFDYVVVDGTADNPINLVSATGNAGGADINLVNDAKIDNTTNGTLVLKTTASGYVSISEGQTIVKGDYLDLDLTTALRFIGAGVNVDGALVFRDNITLGRAGANTTNLIYGWLSLTGTADYGVRLNGAATFAIGFDVENGAATTGLHVGSCTTGILLDGTMANGINATGTFTNHVIDIQPAAGMGAYKAIYVGTWGTEATFDDDGGLFRIYGQVDSGGDIAAMIFTRSLTASSSSIINTQLYADSSADAPGPRLVQALDAIALVNSAGYIATSPSSGDGLNAIRAKVDARVDSVITGNVTALWIDNQVNCVVGGTEYGILATTGGSKPDAFIGFETTSSGWAHLLDFNATAYDQDPVFSTGTCKVDATKNSTGTIKIRLNGTTYYMGYWAVADLTS